MSHGHCHGGKECGGHKYSKLSTVVPSMDKELPPKVDVMSLLKMRTSLIAVCPNCEARFRFVIPLKAAFVMCTSCNQMVSLPSQNPFPQKNRVARVRAACSAQTRRLGLKPEETEKQKLSSDVGAPKENDGELVSGKNGEAGTGGLAGKGNLSEQSDQMDPKIVTAVKLCDPEALKNCIAAGESANTPAIDNKKSLALHWAAFLDVNGSHLECLEILLTESDADVNGLNSDGETAIM